MTNGNCPPTSQMQVTGSSAEASSESDSELDGDGASGPIDLQVGLRYDGDLEDSLVEVAVSAQSLHAAFEITDQGDEVTGVPEEMNPGDTAQILLHGQIAENVECGAVISYHLDISGVSKNSAEVLKWQPQLMFNVGLAEHQSEVPWGEMSSEGVAHQVSGDGVAEYVFAGDMSDSEFALQTPSFPVPPLSQLVFTHQYDTQNMHDGAVLEYSVDGGLSWTDFAHLIVVGGYPSTIWGGLETELAGRDAWSGASDGIREVRVDLSFLANNEVSIRWRMLTDDSVEENPWYVYAPRIEYDTYSCGEE